VVLNSETIRMKQVAWIIIVIWFALRPGCLILWLDWHTRLRPSMIIYLDFILLSQEPAFHKTNMIVIS